MQEGPAPISRTTHPNSAKGVTRRLDELGRIVIPAEYRKVLGINLGDHLDMTLEGTGIVLRRIDPTCVFCDSPDQLVAFRGRSICHACHATLSRPEPHE